MMSTLEGGGKRVLSKGGCVNFTTYQFQMRTRGRGSKNLKILQKSNLVATY